MSIIFQLRKLIDPEQQRREEADRKSQREQPRREADGAAPGFECRVCGLTGNDRSYCPSCLADTMVPIAAK